MVVILSLTHNRTKIGEEYLRISIIQITVTYLLTFGNYLECRLATAALETPPKFAQNRLKLGILGTRDIKMIDDILLITRIMYNHKSVLTPAWGIDDPRSSQLRTSERSHADVANHALRMLARIHFNRICFAQEANVSPVV